MIGGRVCVGLFMARVCSRVCSTGRAGVWVWAINEDTYIACPSFNTSDLSPQSEAVDAVIWTRLVIINRKFIFAE